MNFLTPDLERYVKRRIESGLYQTASEVVCAGLRLLKEREDLHRQTLGELSSLNAGGTLRHLRAARAKTSR